MFRSLYKIITALILVGIIYAPVRFGFELPLLQQATAASLPGEEIGDAILDKGLEPLFENYEEVRETLKAGAAACAATAYILSLLVSAGMYKVQVGQASGEFKDLFLDCLMYQVGNALIEDMLRSLTKWVQGGFKGNPVFVTNINRYTRDIADDAFSSFMEQKFTDEMPFFCSPFKEDLKLQLTFLYQESRSTGRNNACTLTGVVDNIQNFMEGDFLSGGWEGWNSMFSNSQNNPSGAYFAARSELASRIASLVKKEETDISYGKSFLSTKVQDCYYTNEQNQRVKINPKEALPGPYEVVCDEPRTVTPGAFAQEQIGKKFGLPDDRLAFSDELDELLGAVIQKLVSSVLTKDEGGLAEYVIPSNTSPLYQLPPGLGRLEPDEPPGPPGTSMCFVKRGIFLTPSPDGLEDTEVLRLAFPVPVNVSYDKIVLEMDLNHKGWFPDDQSGASYNLFYLYRRNSHDVFGYSNLQSPSKNQIMLKHGVGQLFADKYREVTKRNALPENVKYHVSYVYDTTEKTIELQVSSGDKSSGFQPIGTIEMVPDVTKINTGDERFFMQFGLPSEATIPNERPAYGWEYSDFKIEFLTNGSPEPETCTEAPLAGAGGGGPEPDPRDRNVDE